MAREQKLGPEHEKEFFLDLEARGIRKPDLKGIELHEKQATEIINNLKYAQRNPRYIFRGLHKYCYDLTPSIARKRHDKNKSFNLMDEKIIFMITKNQGMMYRNISNLSDVDLIALSQHFGAPTRLLDWTTNPLVALYFAVFGNNPDQPIDNDIDGIIYIYRSKTYEYIRGPVEINSNDDDKYLFPDNETFDNSKNGKDVKSKIKLLFPKFTDIRIRNQGGLFSIQLDPTSKFDKMCDKDRLTHVPIPKDTKLTLGRYLYGLGITRDFIMPGFEGFCKSLGYRYYYDVDVLSRQLEQSLDESGTPPPEETDLEVDSRARRPRRRRQTAHRDPSKKTAPRRSAAGP